MADELQIEQAARTLREGGVVGIPTETVYGLAADAENELAVRKIFAVKGRPSDHPLIVHVADVAQARSWVEAFPPRAMALAKRFWPGPLTLVLHRSQRASDAVTGGQDTVALRVPRHPVALALLQAFGGGLAAPSANRFGGVSPTTAAHVQADLGGDVPCVLDGGPCDIGLESTIVDLTSAYPAILRPGQITSEDLEAVLGVSVPVIAQSAVRVSGSLASHYAPKAGVMLCSAEAVRKKASALRDAGKRVAGITPQSVALPAGVGRFHLPDDAAGYARALYATLREVDAQGFEVAVIVEPELSGVSPALHDRLVRASAPKLKQE